MSNIYERRQHGPSELPSNNFNGDQLMACPVAYCPWPQVKGTELSGGLRSNRRSTSDSGAVPSLGEERQR